MSVRKSCASVPDEDYGKLTLAAVVRRYWWRPGGHCGPVGRLRHGVVVRGLAQQAAATGPLGARAGVHRAGPGAGRLAKSHRLRAQSQQLAAIGQAVTGVQHAIKNMLGILKGGAYLVHSGLGEGALAVRLGLEIGLLLPLRVPGSFGGLGVVGLVQFHDEPFNQNSPYLSILFVDVTAGSSPIFSLDTPWGRWYICNGFKENQMTPSEKLKKSLSRRLTVMFIPHSEFRPIQLNFSLAFLVFLAVGWTGLTVWSGFIVSRHVDYWRARTNESVLRAKMWYFTQQMDQSREYLDRVKETEIALQNLLKMKTRKAIVESDKGMGGPTALDNRALIGMLTGRRPSLRVEDMQTQLADVEQSGQCGHLQFHGYLELYQGPARTLPFHAERLAGQGAHHFRFRPAAGSL